MWPFAKNKDKGFWKIDISKCINVNCEYYELHLTIGGMPYTPLPCQTCKWLNRDIDNLKVL